MGLLSHGDLATDTADGGVQAGYDVIETRIAI
jgi:hypothetical protein